MLKAVKNYFILVMLYIFSRVNKVKVKLGLMVRKHGILGYFEHDGLPSSTFMHTKCRMAAVKDYDAFRDDDVILFTYPKTGTHFTGEIIASIYKEAGRIEKSFRHHTCGLEAEIPRMLMPGKGSKVGSGTFADMEVTPSPRIIGTHLPWDLLPTKAQNGNFKIINCMRNPKDLVCSYYPFLRTVGVLDETFPWSEFVISFIQGNVLYGGYFSYLKQWYPHRNKANVLNLQFEDMKQDLEGNVRRIAEFLNIELTQEQIDRIVVANTFENKKKEVGKGHIIYRKGKSGAWKSDITVEQNEMLDEWIEREMEDMPEVKFKYS